MNKLLFLDVEATGVDEQDRLLQVAYQAAHKGQEYRINEYFKPPVPINKAAMAIHHVTEEMVEWKEAFEGSATWRHLLDLAREDYVFVAHNAPYDLGMLAKEGIEFKRYIDTLKVAKYLDNGQFQNHQLQYLRYHYDLDVDLGGLAAHDAYADILVLYAVFDKLGRELFNTMCGEQKVSLADDWTSLAVEKMIEISMNPMLLKICNMKKHKGKTWEQVAKEDAQYLKWNLTRDDLGEDERHTINHWLKK